MEGRGLPTGGEGGKRGGLHLPHLPQASPPGGRADHPPLLRQAHGAYGLMERCPPDTGILWFESLPLNAQKSRYPTGFFCPCAGRDSLRFGAAAVQPAAGRCPPDTGILWFESLPFGNKQKNRYSNEYLFFWYAGRDSNPQPSEPESDALSIEPPARVL